MNQLLEKYFRAETSLEEEKKLTAYFLSGEIDEHHKQYAPLFGFFEEEKKVEYPAETLVKSRRVKLRPVWISGVAASLLLVALLLFAPKRDTETFIVVDGKKSYNEELAIEHADEHLKMVAQLMSDALSPIVKAEDNIEKNMEPIRRAEQAIEVINAQLKR